MRITHLRLANWRNFKNVNVPIAQRLFVLGPNASGKSNLLDAIRFLRDLTLVPGGLQYAVLIRGGLSRLRYLNARSSNKGQITIAVSLGDDDDPKIWEYELSFTRSPGNDRRPVVADEVIRHNGRKVYSWKDVKGNDAERATQTGLEQVSVNRKFRPVAEFLGAIDYLNLVPQIVRDPSRGGSAAHDPFGGTFLIEIGKCPKKDFERRRKILTAALQLAVPQFESLDRNQDPDGTWHLQARYKSFRPNTSPQDERDFSDGTLRLIGLLWHLLDRSGVRAPVLLEEPELSLHAAIVRLLPGVIAQAIDASGRQVIASSHGTAILDDVGLQPSEVLLLDPGIEGTLAKLASSDSIVVKLLSSGNFTLAEALQADLVLPEIEKLMSLKML